MWINGQIDVGGVTVTNGSLGGTGIILGAVSVNSPSSLAPGTSAIGTLTINNNLTLAGNGLFHLNKSLVQSNKHGSTMAAARWPTRALAPSM